jgi:hypothetical protein
MQDLQDRLLGDNIFFAFSGTNAGSSADPNDSLLKVMLIDNIEVTAVPEPSTVALTVCGGLGLLLLMRRRKQA